MARNDTAVATMESAPKFSLDQLREDTESLREASFNEIWEAAQADGGLDAGQLGEGFELIQGRDGKDSLIGVPFILFDWKVRDGDYGPFVSARIVTKDERRVILNDGSTGIAQQLGEAEARGLVGPILCRHGLRRSDYTFSPTHPNGEPVLDGEGKPVQKAASTYYVDTRV